MGGRWATVRLVSKSVQKLWISRVDPTLLAAPRSPGRKRRFQRRDACGQAVRLLARLGGHFLHRLEFLAADEIETRNPLAGALACALARLAAHACDGTGQAVDELGEIAAEFGLVLHVLLLGERRVPRPHVPHI